MRRLRVIMHEWSRTENKKQNNTLLLLLLRARPLFKELFFPLHRSAVCCVRSRAQAPTAPNALFTIDLDICTHVPGKLYNP